MTAWVGLMVDRNRENLERALAYVRSLPPGTVVLCGGERKSDQEIIEEAERLGLTVLRYLPNRDPLNREAGALKNKDLVDDCARLVAFHDGRSWGTASAIRYARTNRKLVEVVMD